MLSRESIAYILTWSASAGRTHVAAGGHDAKGYHIGGGSASLLVHTRRTSWTGSTRAGRVLASSAFANNPNEAGISTIQYDDSLLSYDQSAMSGPLASVQSDIKGVQADWQTLKAAVASDASGGVSAQFSQSNIDTAVGNAQKQVDASNSALSQAQSQGTQYDKEAAQMNTDAQNLAKCMHC